LEIPICEIYRPDEINGRDPITRFDVQDIMESIEQNGVIEPVVVMPISDAYRHENDIAATYKWRLVCGFRRTFACALFHTTVNAVISETVTDETASVFNVVENIERKNLNIREEAKAIQTMLDNGFTKEEIAKKLTRHTSWVEQRSRFLDLPEDVQDDILIGTIPVNKIVTLANTYVNRGDKELYEKIDKTLEADRLREQCVRTKPEMMAMMLKLHCKFGPSITDKVLSWAMGDLGTEAFNMWLKEQA
jgi:ParB/RepB/Spo0J family partition protein